MSSSPLVLLVDFDGLKHSALCARLQSQIEIIFAINEEEAKNVIREQKVDLILVQLSVRPEGSFKAIEFTKSILDDGISLPVIAVGKNISSIRRRILLNSGLNEAVCEADLSEDLLIKWTSKWATSN